MIYKILSLKLWCYGALYMFWPVKALLSSSSFTYSPTSKQTFSHTATHHLSLQLLWHSVCKIMTVRWLAFSLSSKRMLHFCTLKPNYFHVIIITDLASFCGAIRLLYPLILAQSLAGGKAGYNPDSLQAMTRLMHKIHNHIHTYVEFLQLSSYCVREYTQTRGRANSTQKRVQHSKQSSTSYCEATVPPTLSLEVTSIQFKTLWKCIIEMHTAS